MKKLKTNQNSVKIVIIAIFLANSFISCKEKDNIVPDPAPPLSTNCCEKLVLYSGVDDNYVLPIDPFEHRRVGEPYPAPANPIAPSLRNYDQAGVDLALVQSFDWRSSGFGPITCATLEFEAKPAGAQDYNDAVVIYPWHFAQNSNSVHGMAGAYLGTDTDPTHTVLGQPIKGLLTNTVWSFPTVSTKFTIDLKDFPSDKFNRTQGGQNTLAYPYGLSGVCYFDQGINNGNYQMEGGYDLTRVMNNLKFLDVWIGDDTIVDYMKLTLLSCDCEVD